MPLLCMSNNPRLLDKGYHDEVRNIRGLKLLQVWTMQMLKQTAQNPILHGARNFLHVLQQY